MYLKILVILSALINVVLAPKLEFKAIETTVETIEIRTIIMSKMFPGSLKYTLGPYAINFIVASIKNTNTKP